MIRSPFDRGAPIGTGRVARLASTLGVAWLAAACAAPIQPLEMRKLTRMYETALFRKTAEHPSLELKRYAERLVRRLGAAEFADAGVEPRVRVRVAPTPGVEIYPHGLIVVDTGVFSLVENEDQLAAMLAHEIAHFASRDVMRDERFERMAQGAGASLGIVAAATLAVVLGADPNDSATQQLGEAGLRLGFLTGKLVARVYSRRLELAADHRAVELLRAQRYAPGALIGVLERLRERGEDLRPRPGGIARFHPALAERVERLEGRLEPRRKANDLAASRPSAPVPFPPTIRRIATELSAQAVVLECARMRSERAGERLADLLARAPGNGHALLARAECMRLSDPDGPRFDDQIEAYWAALLSDPTLAKAYSELGLIYRRLGRQEEARRAFASYVRLAPGGVEAAIFSGYLRRAGAETRHPASEGAP